MIVCVIVVYVRRYDVIINGLYMIIGIVVGFAIINPVLPHSVVVKSRQGLKKDKQRGVEHSEFTLALYRSTEQRDTKPGYQGVVNLKDTKRQQHPLQIKWMQTRSR